MAGVAIGTRIVVEDTSSGPFSREGIAVGCGLTDQLTPLCFVKFDGSETTYPVPGTLIRAVSLSGKS
jgi:hypothetical protein